MKGIVKLILGLILLTAAVTTVTAAEGGNPKKGKYLYKKTCRSCHSDGSEAKALTPMTKTQAQWERHFQKAAHPDKTKAWKGLSEQDLKDIQQYLINHAADSDQPETCG
jgi:mono/diheme cytochrome c family protein